MQPCRSGRPSALAWRWLSQPLDADGEAMALLGRELVMGPLSRLALPVLALVAACLIAVDSVRHPGVTFRIAALSGMAIINLAILVSSPAVMIFLAELGMLVLVCLSGKGRTDPAETSSLRGADDVRDALLSSGRLAARPVGRQPGADGRAGRRNRATGAGSGSDARAGSSPWMWPVLAEAMSPALAALVGVAFPVVGLTILADLAVHNRCLLRHHSRARRLSSAGRSVLLEEHCWR